MGREPLLRRLDAWAYREATDQRQALATAAAALAQARRITTVSRTVTRAVKRGCGSVATLLSATDLETQAGAFHAPDARVGPLVRTSAIVHMLETAGGTLRVHPDDETSFFGLLPAAEAAWVVEADADAIVPVPGPGGVLVGVLAVGRRFADRKVGAADLPFLEALASAAGLAVGGLRAMRAAEGRAREASPANECPACGYVVEPGALPGCGCGSAYVEAEAPTLLAGKFQLTRRLGVGGAGTVYLARDLRLERNVAVKTLTGMSVLGLMGIKPEAWAMAEVTHPAVAQIHGIESWRGHPFLVVEYLAGGTLADRLLEGRVPEPDAVSMTAALAGALAALHDTGYLHGDIKPSNIGFTADGSPKLLDFGLAREANSAAVAGGTLRYASPEVVSGQPADEADDIWSLGRGPVRDGRRRASVRRRGCRRGDRADPAAARRPARAARVGRVVAVGGHCVRGGDTVCRPPSPPGHGAGVRRGAARRRRRRVTSFLTTVRFPPSIRGTTCRRTTGPRRRSRRTSPPAASRTRGRRCFRALAGRAG